MRARKALQLLNIQSVGDLCSHTEAELMGVKNFGATSLVEVREKLTEWGLELRIIDDDEDVGISAMSSMPSMTSMPSAPSMSESASEDVVETSEAAEPSESSTDLS